MSCLKQPDLIQDDILVNDFNFIEEEKKVMGFEQLSEVYFEEFEQMSRVHYANKKDAKIHLNSVFTTPWPFGLSHLKKLFHN